MLRTETDRLHFRLGFFVYGMPIYHLPGFTGEESEPDFLQKRWFHNSRILAITFRGEFWGDILGLRLIQVEFLFGEFHRIFFFS